MGREVSMRAAPNRGTEVARAGPHVVGRWCMTAAARFWNSASSEPHADCWAATGPQRKVGVLTFHHCINYGSYWQARCLVEGLRARGHDAVILDHRSRRADAAEW